MAEATFNTNIEGKVFNVLGDITQNINELGENIEKNGVLEALSVAFGKEK